MIGVDATGWSAGTRRRAWCWTAVVASLVLSYLVVYTGYAYVHTHDRYRPLAPGAAGSRDGAELRVLSLVQTDQLRDSDTSSDDPPQVADAGSTFVVAEVEMVQATPTEYPLCAVDLLGPGGRLWEPASYDLDVQRTRTCSSSDIRVGEPYRFEAVYVVPTVFVDGLVGLALDDDSSPARTPVLRPPA